MGCHLFKIGEIKKDHILFFPAYFEIVSQWIFKRLAMRISGMEPFWVTS
jgi:hypothetical protein